MSQDFLYKVILGSVVSEKATRIGDKHNQYIFSIVPEATKEDVKAAAEAVRTGLRRMHYSEYKTSYSDCETVSGSYDKRTKTIEVMTLRRKGFKRISYNGLCPRCHTYCYGDCMAH